jgi:glutaminyl-tRNA synthetase
MPDPENVEENKSFLDNLNPNSLQTLTHCKIEPFVKTTKPLDHFQFERLGYFTTEKDCTTDQLVFNRTVSLKDSK